MQSMQTLSLFTDSAMVTLEQLLAKTDGDNPNRKHQGREIFLFVHQRLRDTGSFNTMIFNSYFVIVKKSLIYIYIRGVRYHANAINYC